MYKIITLVICLLSSICMAQGPNKYITPHLLQMDPEFSPYAIIVEKSTHQLFLYKNVESHPELVKKYQIATGKVIGLKKFEGDKKTPEGIYNIQDYLTEEELLKIYGKAGEIYGPGALTLDYPNEIDKIERRKGSGIWIHSTDDDSRIEKGLDSRGCVVLTQNDFRDLYKYSKLLNTPVIIVQDHYFLPQKQWKKKRKQLVDTINAWMQAWQNKDFAQYISHYSLNFSDPRKGEYLQYKRYKKRIFRKKDRPIINFSNLSIATHGNYAIIRLKQDYKSQFINDIGEKTLIMIKDDHYNWKIVREKWRAIERI